MSNIEYYFNKGISSPEGIFSQPCDTLVIPVNSQGVAGAGMAYGWKKRFPFEANKYKQVCQLNNFNSMKPFFVRNVSTQNPQRFLMFFSKKHWTKPSKIDYMISGLQAMVQIGSQELGPVVALNQMGCGLGGLDWAVVQTYYEQFLTQIPETRFIVWIQRK